MACKCIGLVDKKLSESDFELDTLMQVDFDTGSGRLLPQIKVRCTRSSRRKPPAVVCTYCPVCGNKF